MNACVDAPINLSPLQRPSLRLVGELVGTFKQSDSDGPGFDSFMNPIRFDVRNRSVDVKDKRPVESATRNLSESLVTFDDTTLSVDVRGIF